MPLVLFRICTADCGHEWIFSPGILENTRLLVLQGERVANPDFYLMLRNLGFKNLLDQSRMGARSLWRQWFSS
jgi:hypothetical protein